MIYWRENRRTRRKTCPSATLSTTNPTWIDQGANPGLRGERLETNRLSHGTAYYVDVVECLVVRLQHRVNWDVVHQLCVWMCVDVRYTAAPSVSTGIDANYLHIWADSYCLINWILPCHWRTSMCKSSRCYIFLNILIVKRIADFSILFSTLLCTWMLTLGSETLPKVPVVCREGDWVVVLYTDSSVGLHYLNCYSLCFLL
jgi:hypothetical protein